MGSIIEPLALVVVLLTGGYFLVLALAALFAPARASGFLLGFASSASTHYIELLIRLFVGVSLVVSAPNMLGSGIVNLFGWVILLTTACLLLVPWRWHQRFAQAVVPRATRYITIIGLCSLMLGILILTAVIRGGAA